MVHFLMQGCSSGAEETEGFGRGTGIQGPHGKRVVRSISLAKRSPG